MKHTIKKIILSLITLAAASPVLVFAQDPGFDASDNGFTDLLVAILQFSNTILIPFILGIGFLVFVWGMFRYFIAGGADEEARASGKNLMIWATLGFVLIIIFWGVVNLIASATGWDASTGPRVESADVSVDGIQVGNVRPSGQ